MPPGEETRPLGLSPEEWSFCDAQPGGASAFLRALVAQARNASPPAPPELGAGEATSNLSWTSWPACATPRAAAPGTGSRRR